MDNAVRRTVNEHLQLSKLLHLTKVYGDSKCISQTQFDKFLDFSYFSVWKYFLSRHPKRLWNAFDKSRYSLRYNIHKC